MCAHDAVAQKDFYPHLPDIPVEVDEDEETIKIVQLVKSNEPLVSKHKFENVRQFWINKLPKIYEVVQNQPMCSLTQKMVP